MPGDEQEDAQATAVPAAPVATHADNLRDTLKRYGEQLDPQTLAVANLALQKHAVFSAEAQIFSVKRVNAAGIADDKNGMHDAAAVLRNLITYQDAHPLDENLDAISNKVKTRLSNEKTFRELQGQEALSKITYAAAQAAAKGGQSGYDFSTISSDDRVTLASLSKDAYKALDSMMKAESATLLKQDRAKMSSTNRGNLENLRLNLVDLAGRDPDAFKALTPSKIGSMMNDTSQYPGVKLSDGSEVTGFPLPGSLKAAEGMLKSLKDAAAKPNFSAIRMAATTAANDRFPGRFSGPDRKQAQAKVLQYLLENAKDEANPVSLHATATEFLKGDWKSYEIGNTVDTAVEAPEPPKRAQPAKASAAPPFLNGKEAVWIYGPGGAKASYPKELVDRFLTTKKGKEWHK